MIDSAGADLRTALRAVPLFQNLNESELDAVAAEAAACTVEQDGFFFHQGSTAEHVHVLEAGQVRIYQLTPAGDQVLLRFIHPRQMFGGVGAFGVPEYPVSAQAVGTASAWRWSSATLRGLVAQIPQLALNALDYTAGTIQQLQDRVRELQTERVERRVARALLRLARQSGRRVEQGILIDHALSRQDLAELTGTNLYSVSRILAAWEKQGLVESGRERIVLRVPHKLVILAEDLVPRAH